MTRLPLSRVVLDGNSGDDRSEIEVIPSSVPPETSAPPLAGSAFALPEWVLPVLLAVAAAGVVVVIALVIGAQLGPGTRFHRRALRRRAPASSTASRSDVDAEVVAALEAGLSELDEAEADPRRTVIACWVRLERAAGAAGTERLRGDTATDLVLRLLKAHQLSARVLTGFADVYLQARFASRHEVDENMREQAKAALRRLRGELTGVTA